jgi:hypothetical protein
MTFRSIGDTAFCSRFLYEPAGARLYVLRKAGGEGPQSDAEASDLLTGAIVPPPALVRAGLEALPAIIRNRGERASRRLIEVFTASIRNPSR